MLSTVIWPGFVLPEQEKGRASEDSMGMPLPMMGGALEVPGGIKRPDSKGRPWVTGKAAPRFSPWKAVPQLMGRWPDKGWEWAGKVASDWPLTARLNVHMDWAALSKT